MRFISFQRVGDIWRADEALAGNDIYERAHQLSPPELALLVAWVDVARHGDIHRSGVASVIVAIDDESFNAVTPNSRSNESKPAEVAGMEVQKSPPIVTPGNHDAGDRQDALERVKNDAGNCGAGGLFG
jgi:hypothetical protein